VMPYPRVKQQPARSGPTQKRGLRATGTSEVLLVSTVQKNATLTVMGSIRRKLTHPKSKQDLLFRNQSTGKALSDRIWRDSLQEMLVESGLTTLAEGDSNDLRKTEIASGKNLTWYSFRHTWITFALERGVPIATVCNNCDTSIQYVQEHYFHSDAKRATDALSTGRGQLKGATGNG
jgi:hypothetical protein